MKPQPLSKEKLTMAPFAEEGLCWVSDIRSAVEWTLSEIDREPKRIPVSEFPHDEDMWKGEATLYLPDKLSADERGKKKKNIKK
jgi:hypothetical protein